MRRALEGAVVCSTGIGASEKQELQRKVAQLLGDFKGDLTSDVTHLVAQEVQHRTDNERLRGQDALL